MIGLTWIETVMYPNSVFVFVLQRRLRFFQFSLFLPKAVSAENRIRVHQHSPRTVRNRHKEIDLIFFLFFKLRFIDFFFILGKQMIIFTTDKRESETLISFLSECWITIYQFFISYYYSICFSLLQTLFCLALVSFYYFLLQYHSNRDKKLKTFVWKFNFSMH